MRSKAKEVPDCKTIARRHNFDRFQASLMLVLCKELKNQIVANFQCSWIVGALHLVRPMPDPTLGYLWHEESESIDRSRLKLNQSNQTTPPHAGPTGKLEAP